MKTSYDLAKMFFDQNQAKGKKNGSYISPKQAQWIRDVYKKENPNTQYHPAKALAFYSKESKTYYSLNGVNSLWQMELK